MVRLFLSLTIISIVIVGIWSSDGYTVHNSLLTGHVFKTIESIDWLQYIQECHKEDQCISYNYFRAEEICELNNFGFDDECEAGNNLIRATGWIHHVLDISQVIAHANIGLLSIFIALLCYKDSIVAFTQGNKQKYLSKKRTPFSSFP